MWADERNVSTTNCRGDIFQPVLCLGRAVADRGRHIVVEAKAFKAIQDEVVVAAPKGAKRARRQAPSTKTSRLRTRESSRPTTSGLTKLQQWEDAITSRQGVDPDRVLADCRKRLTAALA